MWKVLSNQGKLKWETDAKRKRRFELKIFGLNNGILGKGNECESSVDSSEDNGRIY